MAPWEGLHLLGTWHHLFVVLAVALTVVGLLLVVLVCYDAVLATVSPTTGPGPLMRLWLWVAMRAPRGPLQRVLPAGSGVLPGTVVLWTAVLWAGWTLVLGAGGASIVDSTTRAPADVPSRLYYAGYTILTLGTGDYVPSGTYAQVLTVLAAFNGLFVITLAVTYQMNVVAAVVLQRTLAGRVHLLGASGRDVLERWQDLDGGPDLLQEQLSSLAKDVVELTQQHIAYPVLHRFAETEPSRSAPVAVAVLDQTLELLAAERPSGAVTASERVLALSIDAYVLALDPARVTVTRPGPPPGSPRRDGLRRMLVEVRQAWPEVTAPPAGAAAPQR